jgi:prevent-host-death family protein
MSSVGSRELRNNTRAVLDRVAAGEDVTITVDGHPVAHLVPIERKPRFMRTEEFLRGFVPADRGLREDLREVLGDETTDDLTW